MKYIKQENKGKVKTTMFFNENTNKYIVERKTKNTLWKERTGSREHADYLFWLFLHGSQNRIMYELIFIGG